MKRFLLSVVYSILIACFLNATSISDNAQLVSLYNLADKNLNYSAPISEDRILELCYQLEKTARRAKDYDNLFRIQLIAINSECFKGNLGLAVSKAQAMYDEANELKSDLGISLSIQAIGNTYMYSNEMLQAYNAFVEAEILMYNLNDNYSKIRLLMQQMHVCMLMKDMNKLQKYLNETHKLLNRIDFANERDYYFYYQCYQTSYYLGVKDLVSAKKNVEKIKAIKPSDGVFDRWYYTFSFRYYELMGDYEKALLYCDSATWTVTKANSVNEYKTLLIEKADLLEMSGDKSEACDLYELASNLTDSLNVVSYSQQIDSLHISYWIDRMELKNTAMFNRLLTWIILSSFFILVSVLILIGIAQRRNKKLVKSRKQLEELRQVTADSIQAKNLFLSNMSHELRTPLNAIVGFSDLLTSDNVTDFETRQQCSDLIKQNSELLLKLFNDVADLSALKEENIRFDFKPCEVISLCSIVIDTVAKVKQTSADLCFNTSHEKLELYTDPGRLQQVLINLLINATKFTQNGMITLTLDVDIEREEVIFKVKDTGCGIPLEKQPHIFERFEKLHEGVQGAGLGLSICQLIVEHVGGRIWIDSSYTNGACFVFTHPLTNKSKQVSV